MNPKQWATIRELFAKARELPKDEQKAFVEESSTDMVVIDQVTTLLANDQEDDFLSKPALGGNFTLADSESPDEGMNIPTNLIAGYSITTILGSGASGIVYEAQQHEPKRMVAIKVLRAGAMGSDDRARFQREAETLANLEHQNVATVHAVGSTDDGSPWMSMEFVDGQRLDDSMEGKSSKDIVEIMLLISDAVCAAHKKNIVHRDLKPANILVGKDEQPRVLDFGVARITSGEDSTIVTQTGAVIGTQKYMSPEQAAGSSNVDARSDVYALGIMLKEFLVHDAPKDLKTIATKASDEFPNRRYNDAGEFHDDLLRWSNNTPIHARRATPWYVTSLWVQRHKAISALIALVAIVAVLAFFDSQTKGRAHYASLIQQAQLAYEQGDLTQMNDLLNTCGYTHRNWEWQWLHQLATVGELPVKAMDISALDKDTVLAITPEGNLVNAISARLLYQLPETPKRSLLARNCSKWVSIFQDGTLLTINLNSLIEKPVKTELGVPHTHIASMDISDNGNFVIIAMSTPFDPQDPSSFNSTTRIVCFDVEKQAVLFEDVLQDRALDNDSAIAISNNGSTAAIAMIDGGIVVWRQGAIHDRRSIRITNGSATISLDSEGELLAIGSISTGVANIHLLNVSNLAQLDNVPIIAHDYAILSIDISPDKSKIVSIDASGMLQITPLDGSTPLRELTREKEQGVDVVFSDDSKQILIRSADGVIRTRPAYIVSSTIDLSSSNPIERAVVTNDKIYIVRKNNIFQIYSLADSTLEEVQELAFATLKTTSSSPDKSRYVTIDNKSSIQVWDSQSSAALLTLSWPGQVVLAAGFSNDGKTVIAVSLQGKIKLWNVGNKD
jgi:serine/threonine protein kinase